MQFDRSLALVTLLAPVTILSLPSIASADGGGHVDLWITGSPGQSLVTGGWDHETGKVVAPFLRVFEGDLGADPSFPTSGDEPGIGSDLIGASITMNLLAGLGLWTGSGFESTGTTLLASYGGQDAFSSTGGSFSFLVSSGLDLHPEYTLLGGDANPAPGIYLAAFTADSEGFSTSEVFWITFNLGLDEETHEAATAWVESNLVPAPGAIVLLAIAGVVRHRRRRH